ncbi:protein roadkill-like [Nasonia vitripennis]|uniref:BTB domain-containing protein n=1 Tax=Nasonia vitripennis TaxID=7425 RepID=A0A7M7G5W0_NASVI|nr:protein roadkill-like [Nasonia vitripennis]XP_008216321.1 protein roadkill-like [Nasonia vitripennis]XP_016836594.1 protein roadkill-like [Nasonia vitripennis]
MPRVIAIGDVNVLTSCTCVATYQWEIKNVWLCCTEPGTALVSPEFLASHDSNPVIRCQFLLYPKGRTNEFNDYFSVFVNIISKSTAIKEVSLSIFNDECEVVTRLFQEPVEKDMGLWGAENFANRFVMKFRAKNVQKRSNNFKIFVKIFTVKTTGYKGVMQSRRVMGHNINDDFEKFVNNNAFSDIVLTVGRKSFAAHKIILCRKSPAFAKIFMSQMRAKQEVKKLRIPNIKYDVCLEMLRYIYTDKVYGIDNIANDLLMAAERYALPGLKSMCEKSMIKSLNFDNIIERLQLAFWCKADILKYATIGFVIEHSIRIVGKQEFKLLPDDILDELSMAVNNSLAY